MVHDQLSELVTVKAGIQLIRDALTGHAAVREVAADGGSIADICASEGFATSFTQCKIPCDLCVFRGLD